MKSTIVLKTGESVQKTFENTPERPQQDEEMGQEELTKLNKDRCKICGRGSAVNTNQHSGARELGPHGAWQKDMPQELSLHFCSVILLGL